MEPWLDSLSEDWKSEHQSSSPAPSFSSSQQSGSIALSHSQSRIPHLARNMRKESGTGSFLRHRSSKGQARVNGEPILRERSASSLNVPYSLGSQKYTSLPRRPSSAFSESQNSVQHHTLDEKPTLLETPEWKRRLANSENVATNGFDLFSPSKLQGMFTQPTSSQLNSDNDTEAVQETKPMRPFNLPPANPFPMQYSSVRETKSRLNLDVLEEVEEEESEQHNLPVMPSGSVRTTSVGGLVRQRVASFERTREMSSAQSSPRSVNESHGKSVYNARDPRWRTLSGQEELKNEFISPVTVSKQNSIRATVLRSSDDIDIDALERKLKQAASEHSQRPTSSSSDRDVSYGASTHAKGASMDEPLPDLTSLSLPDDLSMGTQDFASHGGFINSRRGGRSNDNSSFLRKSLSLSQEPSRLGSHPRGPLDFHSSPPQQSRGFDDSIDDSRITVSAPVTPQDTSVVHHTDAHLRPVLSGSPLKLFGNRDTYTNNKLLRILSQFEQPEESIKPSDNDDSYEEPQDNALPMSQFGQGDLDTFGFEQEIPRPAPVDTASVDSTARIFKSTSLSKETLGTIVRSENSGNQPPNQAAPLEKERTTKRRKTLLKEQLAISNTEVELKLTFVEDPASLAGTKRKDARAGAEGAQADAEVLASRDLLKPKSARRQSTEQLEVAPVADKVDLEQADQDVTEALAAELAAFAQEAVHVHEESRKPSLATKDYMEEANKVMQFIRARGKPQPVLRDITEPEHASELNPDAILDLEIDGDSTRDSFSRPPSRERPFKPASDRRHARHDPQTEDYLKRYQDRDDLEALTSNSVFGTWAQVDNRSAVEAARVPVPDDFQESDPPNIRILNPTDTMRKRKHSASTIEGPHDPDHEGHFHTQQTQNSSQNSFPTNSSSTAGLKGVIAFGTVSIPERVGGMTFDHEKKMWVKKMQKDNGINIANDQTRETLGEADPFEDIPDLSTDELEELQAKARQLQGEAQEAEMSAVVEDEIVRKTAATSRAPVEELDSEAVFARSQQQWDAHDEAEEVNQSSLRSRVSEHEVKLHDGMASRPPAQLNDNRKQARVVTIAFSSPVVSGINYARMSDEDFDALPREDDLPLDESQIALDDSSLNGDSPHIEPAEILSASLRKKHHKVVIEKDHVLSFRPRTISTIAEHDEEYPAGGMSLIHANRPNQLTPAPSRSIVKLQKGAKGASILCLTPLSEFSVHQVDSVKHPDQSYVEERKHPNALRHAHGSMALAVDSLMKAITDAAPDELYWDDLRKMSLAPRTITSVHSLKDYCPALEELTVSQNQITQLGGLPSSLRILDIRNNLLNDLTSWAHLQNLQYLDVSDNALESLEGFSSLVHLRSLKANNNRITNIDGILDLDGLLDLQLSGNQLMAVDFEGAELSRLRNVDLSNNHLREVKNIGCLPQLKKLDLSSNAIQHFDSELQGGDMILEELRLSYNELQVIGLEHMPMLRCLDLDGNQINDIRGLSTAYNLEVLSVREEAAGSQIVNLVLSTANECRTIMLSSNSVSNGTIKLPTLPQNNLRELELAACGITELPEGFGTSFPNCRYLNANFNAIKDIAPLRKMAHLNHLLLAKNRVKRLRRTCLVLSRLASLERIDLRDNPLTVGFYSPVSGTADNRKSLSEARYHLPDGLPKEDASWVKALDEVTGLKRRTTELLLADHCKQLVELDGLTLCRERLSSKDDTWTRLTNQGVLVKSPGSLQSVVVEKPADEVRHSLNEVVLRQETSMIMDCDVFDG